mmetsp:Transcript_26193/g.38734  ORF Transcript_26193/g.38734 Transcript_26193/m.38734 type:complete len:234 (+) Transcript_26193:182-883(+)
MSNVHGIHSNKEDDEEEKSSNNRYVGGVDSRGGGSGLAVEPNERDAVFGMAEQGGSEERPRRTITMYRDGFVVDDGPYRRLDDPNNADFLRSLAMGRTPTELMEQGENVTVGLIDKRKDDYVEQFSSFSGEGNSLGTATVSEDGIINPASLPSPPTALDESQPTTSIQVRLLNGQRRVIKINTSAQVQDLAAHIGGEDSFRLVSGFPPKPITDLTQSIEDAGLKGAQVLQKAA